MPPLRDRYVRQVRTRETTFGLDKQQTPRLKTVNNLGRFEIQWASDGIVTYGPFMHIIKDSGAPVQLQEMRDGSLLFGSIVRGSSGILMLRRSLLVKDAEKLIPND